jgi:hypothetical protein
MSFAAPLWLLALVPVFGAVLLLSRYPRMIGASLPGAWAKVVHPDMRQSLAGRVVGEKSLIVPMYIGVAVLLVFALARPIVGTSNVASYENLMGRAIVLDLSGAVDVAEQKLIVAALLDGAGDIPTTLIALASDGYDVVPLTRDTAFLERYLQVLKPEIMPESGRALHLGVLHADAVLEQAGILTRQTILVTGGEAPTDLPTLPEAGRKGALFAINAKVDAWAGAAKRIGLESASAENAQALTADLRRRAEITLHDLSETGQIRLASFLIALAGLFWLYFFRRRVRR